MPVVSPLTLEDVYAFPSSFLEVKNLSLLDFMSTLFLPLNEVAMIDGDYLFK